MLSEASAAIAMNSRMSVRSSLGASGSGREGRRSGSRTCSGAVLRHGSGRCSGNVRLGQPMKRVAAARTKRGLRAREAPCRVGPSSCVSTEVRDSRPGKTISFRNGWF